MKTESQLPRVTEILRATESKEDRDRLRKWQNKMDKVHGKGAAEEFSQDARERGQQFHKAIEIFMSVGTLPTFENPTETSRWNYAMPYLRMVEKNVISLEREVISHKHQYLGHLDCLAYGSNGPIVIDWKTSKRTKKKAWLKNYYLQVTAYAIAVNEEIERVNKNELVKECQIYICSPTRTQLFIANPEEYTEEWIERLTIYKNLTH